MGRRNHRESRTDRPSISRSQSRSRSRSVSRRNSVYSQEALGDNHEIYSGAGSEIIPSSITSFHYPHSFGRKQSNVSRETSPLLQTEDIDLQSVRSYGTNVSNDDNAANFKFFKLEEIEQAPGGSTYENSEEIVDYNTEWEYPNDRYEVEEAIEDDFISNYNEQPGFDQQSFRSSNFDRRRSSFNSQDDLLDDTPIDYNCLTKYQRYYLAEEDIVIGIAGYRTNILKQLFYYAICTLTLGIGYLILRWMPRYRINLIGDQSPLGKSDWCVIENEYGELTIAVVEKRRFNQRLSNYLPVDDKDEYEAAVDPVIPSLHTFKYRYLKFFYTPVEDLFKTNNNWFDPKWLSNVDDGISLNMLDERTMIFEENNIEIEDKSIFTLLIEEVLHPFYVFQIFSIILWLLDDYYYYATCIFLISMVSVVNTLVETKSTMNRLKDIGVFNCDVRVWRNEFWKTVSLNELVPGDVFEVDPTLSIMPCDCLLTNGEVVVNESMLTGESVPVTKIAVHEEQLLLIKENINLSLSKSFLYNGTKIMKRRSQNEDPVKALVIKTGFNTTKGSLIRSMLFPKPVGFKFYEDSFKYIGFMTLIAFIGFIYSTYNFIKMQLPKSLMILRALDIITIVVPPALPATLTIGTTFAINRLKNYQIYCISPTRVNIGGKLDVICFDKTGTLTEDGLDVLGVHLTNNAEGRKEWQFEPLSKKVNEIPLSRPLSNKRNSNNGPLLIGLMSTCHSLIIIDNEILGDPLDQKMFDFTKSTLKETEFTTVEDSIGKSKILKEFEFEADLRRMSCVVETNTRKNLFCKGAPEVMLDICDPTTIPSNFVELLHEYTNNGFRVIACANKEVEGNTFTRDLETDLKFLGFIIFENKLKKLTTPTITQLKNASIRTVMCTGDNILTAISVGKECGIVNKNETIYVPKFDDSNDEGDIIWHDIDNEEKVLNANLAPVDFIETYKFAITGNFFKFILNNYEDHKKFKILLKCEIFARMSPDEKHELVNQLQKIDYTVGFIGDGANDCGALKAADVGISLSEAEASIAAPFTSTIFEVSCLINVIKEGRSSLVTSFSSFKFMSLYSAIQFITVSILYKRGTNLGDFQFLYIDLVLILPLAIFMSWSKPHDKLIAKRPSANLVSMKILSGLVFNILILLIFQLIIWNWVQTEPWYVKPVPGDDENVKSFDNSVLFLFTNFQYILISILLTEGPPYRQPLYENLPYLINVVVNLGISSTLFLVNSDGVLGDIFQLVNLPIKYYWIIWALFIINYLVLYLMNKYVYHNIHKWYKRVSNHRHSKKLYKNLKREFSKIESV